MKILSLTLIFAHLVHFILKTHGFSMEMIPIDSPHLRFLPRHLTIIERHEFLTNLSLARAYNSAQRNNYHTLDPNSFSLSSSQLGGYYITSLKIGKKPGSGPTLGDGSYDAYVVLDTGDFESWIQCEGCRPCIPFEGDKFDYRMSITYERMTMYDRLCNSFKQYQGSCGYTSKYGLGGPDDPESKGFVGKDTFFFLNPREQQLEAYPGLAFGCGFENKNFESYRVFSEPQNRVSGIHGLAPGPRSFIQQLSHIIKGRFSYCLSPIFRQQSTTMYFGDSAQIRGDATRKLETFSMSLSTSYRYYLAMTGISVDGDRLPIDPSILQMSPDGRKGVLIDSGSPYTTLVKSVYDPFYDAVVNYFARIYGWRPLPYDPSSSVKFKICYNPYPYPERGFPSIVFHFQRRGQTREIDMAFPMTNMLVKVPKDQTTIVYCVAVLDINDPGPSFFGAYQQTNFRFLYDIYNHLMSFVRENCRD